MIAPTATTRPLWAIAGLLVPACAWAHLDAIGSNVASPDAGPLDAPAESELVEAPDESQAPDAIPDSPDEGDTAAETSTVDEAAAPAACASALTPVRQWTFDANTEGWTVLTTLGTTAATATVSWAATRGNPPGALQFDGKPGTPKGAWLRYAMPLGDLSHRIATAWVWLESGTSPQVKLFVQTGTTYAWADAGTVVLAPRAWTCLSFDLSAPQYNQPNYDPTKVITLGFETQAIDPFRLYVDDVRYY